MIVDSNVVLDLFDDESRFNATSAAAFARLASRNSLVINEIVFAEISGRFASAQLAQAEVEALGLAIVRLSLDDCHSASTAFRAYRRTGTPRTTILPDFLIGAQAATRGWSILTRDSRRFSSYFSEVTLIDPTEAAQ